MPHLIAVDDPADPRLAPYRDIRDRDLKGRAGSFVAEGRVVLDALFRGGRFEPSSVLLLESRVAGMADVLAKAPPDLPVYVAPPAVMDAVAGFPVHRGILGIARRRLDDTLDSVLSGLPERALVVACAGIANHDNAGAIFRNAAAFGAAAVLLDATSCDPLYRKAVRVSVGAALTVPFAIGGDAQALLAALDAHGFTSFALSPAGTSPLSAIAPARRTALFLGAEGPGLPAALLERMQTVRIPMAAGWDSLNVATAAALALYELSGR